MATHSSILAWRIPWTEKPGGQQSLGWQKVGHNLATKSSPHGNSVFSFKGISIPFSIVHVSAYIPTNSVGGFPFLHSLSSIYCLFSSVQSLSHVRIFVTPWTAARQASLSITNSWSLVKLMSIESVMLFNHLILCSPLPLLPSIFPSIRVFSSESVLYIRWPKY